MVRALPVWVVFGLRGGGGAEPVARVAGATSVAVRGVTRLPAGEVQRLEDVRVVGDPMPGRVRIRWGSQRAGDRLAGRVLTDGVVRHLGDIGCDLTVVCANLREAPDAVTRGRDLESGDKSQ